MHRRIIFRINVMENTETAFSPRTFDRGCHAEELMKPLKRFVFFMKFAPALSVLLLLSVLAGLLLFSSPADARLGFGRDAASSPDRYFSTNAEGLDSFQLVSPPPAQESALFLYDKERYAYGRSLRATSRGKQAARDCDTHRMQAYFSEAFGGDINPETMPELFSLLERVRREFGNMSTRTAKETYNLKSRVQNFNLRTFSKKL